MSDSAVSLATGPTEADLAEWLEVLAAPSPAYDDAARITRIAMMERLKSALSAAQARETVAFKTSQVAEQVAAGVAAADRGKGVSAQVALARRLSPNHGARLVGLADALASEMPNTMAALTAGVVSEWRATLVARETACLSREDRISVDAALAGRLECMSDQQVVAQTRRRSYELDPASVVARSRKAVEDRRVTIRPAPDTMALVSALLPAAQGVAVYAALVREAAGKRAGGDFRGRGQVMADTLVERVTGQAAADQVPVEVQLLMTDGTMLAGDQVAARLESYGPIPAAVARDLVRDLEDDTRAWVRRLYSDQCSGRLVAMDSKRRSFSGAMRRAIVVRDEFCRTPWCGAAIRHADHVVAAEEDGPTSEGNGQGLCEACNHTKQAIGWRSRPDPIGGAGLSVEIRTPTGHSYASRPPPLPGAKPLVPLPEAEPPAQRERQLGVDGAWNPLITLHYAARPRGCRVA